MWTPTYVCDVRDVQTNQKTGGSEMGLNDTPSANRVHIGFFGCRNAGKSSLGGQHRGCHVEKTAQNGQGCHHHRND